jgi:methylmalonyl-CoA/ethylmalonyl-CoA epimerase
MSEMKVEGIGQIGLTVSDLARSRQFYEGVLGLQFLFDAGTMVFLQCGTVRVMLGLPEPAAEPLPVGGTIVYFKVYGIEKLCAALVDQGIVLTQGAHLVARMADHELWMAFLEDPDGRVVGLMDEVGLKSAALAEPVIEGLDGGL